MMENHVRWLEESGGSEFPMKSAGRAAKEIARPMVFGVAIIIAVYLPILFLQGLEGRMFRPMAVTVCSALLGSLLMALTVIPTIATVLFRRHRASAASRPRKIPRWAEYVNNGYRTMLEWTTRPSLFDSERRDSSAGSRDLLARLYRNRVHAEAG